MNALQQVSSPMVLIPAYGRSYPNIVELRDAWLDGIDFKISPNGPYTSIRDIKRLREDCSTLHLYDPVSGCRVRLK